MGKATTAFSGSLATGATTAISATPVQAELNKLYALPISELRSLASNQIDKANGLLAVGIGAGALSINSNDALERIRIGDTLENARRNLLNGDSETKEETKRNYYIASFKTARKAVGDSSKSLVTEKDRIIEAIEEVPGVKFLEEKAKQAYETVSRTDFSGLILKIAIAYFAFKALENTAVRTVTRS